LHTSALINEKIGIVEQTCSPQPHAKFHVYPSNVSPLWGEKNHFYAKIFNTSTTLVLFEIVSMFNYSLTEHLVKIEPY